VARKLGVGLHVEPGREHEVALVRARVRNLQHLRVDLERVKRDEVKVESAVAPPFVALATVGRLDRAHRVEQRVGVEPGLQQGDAVEVRRSLGVETVDRQRHRCVPRRDGQDARVGQRVERRHGVLECRLPVAEVAAERDDGSRWSRAPAVRGISVRCRGHARPRTIVTLTSSNGTGIGACGLCTVTSTSCTAG